jgi:hypothetical protein
LLWQSAHARQKSWRVLGLSHCGSDTTAGFTGTGVTNDHITKNKQTSATIITLAAKINLYFLTLKSPCYQDKDVITL